MHERCFQVNYYTERSMELEALLKEYETINAFHIEMCKQYIKVLYLVGIAFAAIGTLLVNVWSELDNKCIFIDVLGAFSIVLVLIMHMWFAGWTYSNLELWATRNYLKLIENKIKYIFRLKQEDKSPFHFFNSNIFGIYDRNLYFTKSRLIDLSFIVSLLFVYAFLLFLSCQYGFPALAKYFFRNSHDINYIPIGTYSSWAFLVISLSLLGLTIKARKSIGKTFRERVETTTRHNS